MLKNFQRSGWEEGAFDKVTEINISEKNVGTWNKEDGGAIQNFDRRRMVEKSREKSIELERLQ